MRIDQKWIFRLFMLAILTHGLMLINDGIYWESWNIHTNYVSVDGDANAHRVSDIDGRVFSRLIYREIIAFLFPNFAFGFRLAAFSCIIISTLLIYLLSGYVSTISQAQRFWLSAFVLASPHHVLSLDYVYVQYSLDVMLFYLATLLAIQANVDQHQKWLRLIFRIFAILLFFLSFSTGSLLVFYLGAYVYMIYATSRFIFLPSSDQTAPNILRQILKNLDFLFLPIIFWLGVRMLFPQTAQWILELGYNQLSTSVLFDFKIWSYFLYIGILALVNNSIQFYVTWPFAIILFLLYLARKLAAHRQHSASQFKVDLRNFFITLTIGIIGVLLATFPYIAVGREIYPDSFLNNLLRYFVLYPLPVAILCLALTHMLSRRMIVVILLAFIYANLDLYLVYQARFVKDLSVRQHLINSNLQSFSIIRTIDQYPTDNRFPTNFGQDFPFEQTAYFHWILNAPNWPVAHPFKDNVLLTHSEIVVPWIASSPAMIGYMQLQKLDVLGCYGQLVISKSDYTQTLTPLGVSLRYWYYRFMRSQDLDKWLSQLSIVVLQKIEIPGTLNCKA